MPSNIQEWLKDVRSAGYSKEQIINQLKSQGWAESDIQNVLTSNKGVSIEENSKSPKPKKWLIIAISAIIGVPILYVIVALAIYYIQKESPIITLESPNEFHLYAPNKTAFSFTAEIGNAPDFFPLTTIIPFLEGGDKTIESCWLDISGETVKTNNSITEDSIVEFMPESMAYGEQEWEIYCKDNSLLFSESKSETRSILLPEPPSITINLIDSTVISYSHEYDIHFSVEPPKNTVPEDILQKYGLDSEASISCWLLANEEQNNVLNNVSFQTELTITYEDVMTGSNNIEVACGIGLDQAGKSEKEVLNAIVPLSLKNITDVESTRDKLPDITITLASIESDIGYGTRLFKTYASTAFEELWLSIDIDEFEIARGIVAIDYNGNPEMEQHELIVTTNTGEYTIYIPDMESRQNVGNNAFYVANDGSTFWQIKNEGIGNVPISDNPRLTGLQALHPDYLARAAPGFPFTTSDGLSFDWEQGQDELQEVVERAVCERIPCTYIGDSFINSEGAWDMPPEYVSATYPYVVTIDESGEYDMKLKYRFGKDITWRLGAVYDPPNTLNVIIDGNSLFQHTLGRGEPSSAGYESIISLGSLSQGSHTLEFTTTSESSLFVFSEFQIDSVASYGDPDIVLVEVDDADNDGLSDIVENMYKTDENNPDTDGDGVNDGDEVRAGSNPNGEGNLIEVEDPHAGTGYKTE
ncbi:hypothetical protein ACFL0L_03870 [Patescibacteria group bacterium]